MATVVVVHPADERARLLVPRDDALVRERAEGPATFVADDGPFRAYRRELRDGSDGSVEERFDFHLATRVWGLLFLPGYRRALARPPSSASPWWAPPERLDHRAAEVLGLLCSLTLVSGYLGTLLTQTVKFAADEFARGTTGQSGALATTRVGVLGAFVLMTVADRVGRRRVVISAGLIGCVIAATGALAPNLVALTASQTLNKAFVTALALLILVVSAEEMPAGSRAYAYGLLTMSGGLGAGMCVWFLPLADVGERGWRILYLLPLLFVPLLLSVRRHLPETRRFEAPHPDAPIAGHGRRFWLLVVSGALLAVFAAPASQLQNDFLTDERGFSATRIALFTILTVTPGSIGVVLGGRLADTRGRRLVAAVGILGGVGLSILQFVVPGWGMWGWAIASSVFAGAVAPSYGVFKSELFPTSLRGRMGGVVELLTVVGSAVGLLTVGRLVDDGWSYGAAFATVAPASLLVALLVLVAFPETAHRSLEDLNPEDDRVPSRREDS